MIADTLLLRALKGAPLSCLLALRHGGKLGASDLEVITGYERVTIWKALRMLESLGLATPIQRFHGWQLTLDAVQLPLFIPSELEPPEVENINLKVEKNNLPLLGGGGGFSDSVHTKGLINTTTTTAWEVENINLKVEKNNLPPESALRPAHPVDNPVDNSGADPESLRLAEILVSRLLCSRTRALTAVTTARTAGATSAEIEIEILCWVAWLSDEGTNTKGIRNPGFFVTKKIAEREAAPPVQHVVSWSVDDRRIQALRCQLESCAEEEIA